MALTHKQEAFANAVVTGKSQAEAYRMAYNAEKMKDATIWSKASVLMANGKVAERVAELRKSVAEAAQITLDSHLDALKELRNKADKKEQYSAAISAEVARGKAAGLYVDRTEVTGANGTALVQPPSMLETARRLAFVLRAGIEQSKE